MVCCSVFGCKSNTNLKATKFAKVKISFFAFPADPKVCKVWLERCYRKDKINRKYARICSRHFTPDDYKLKYKLMNLNAKTRRLLPEAVPSVNLPVAGGAKQQKSKGVRRRVDRDRRESTETRINKLIEENEKITRDFEAQMIRPIKLETPSESENGYHENDESMASEYPLSPTLSTDDDEACSCCEAEVEISKEEMASNYEEEIKNLKAELEAKNTINESLVASLYRSKKKIAWLKYEIYKRDNERVEYAAVEDIIEELPSHEHEEYTELENNDKWLDED